MALSKYVALLCLGALSHFCSQVIADTCTVQSKPTRCDLTDGSNRYIDLAQVIFQNFKSNDGSFTYAFDPSGTELNNGGTCTPGNQAAACQHTGEDWYTLGLASQVSVDVQPNANPVTSTWTYSGGDSDRVTSITITCGGGTPGTINDEGEHPELTYNFVLTSQDGCLQTTGVPTTPEPGPTEGPTEVPEVGISPGSVTVIIFFSVGTIYIAGGIALMRVRSGAQGLEMIPNREFWVSIPGLIKDGVMFLFSPCRRGGGDYEKL